MQILLKNISKVFHIREGKKVALDNVSLFITEGERVGIIGRNGAGKTTLLRIIAGITKPTSGEVQVEGHINCIMELGLGLGLREELSGRENIYLHGEIKGKSQDQINKLIDEIISFIDIGEFIDYPVHAYSTGMKARLAFAMNVFIDPGIIIIDEVLSVGDSHFSRKATQKMKEICSKSKILIFTSHSTNAIIEMCNRCIWLDKGRIIEDGDPLLITKAYIEAIRKEKEEKMLQSFTKRIGSKSFNRNYWIEKVEFIDADNINRHIWRSDEEMKIRLFIKTTKKLKYPDIKILFERLDGNILIERLASEDGFKISPIEGEAIFEIGMDKILFGQSIYEVHIELLDIDNKPMVVAEYNDIIKVENPENVIDYPAYFTTIEWKSKYIGEKI